MKKIIAVAAFVLMSGAAFAGDTSPLPQAGKDPPGVTKGAKESGAMDTSGKSSRDSRKSHGAASGGAMHDNRATTGMSRTSPTQDDANGSPNAPPTAKQGPQGDPSKANDTPK